MRIFLFKHTGLSQGREYKFSSVNQAVLWPQEDGIRLGMAGAWNLLFRAGIRPHIVDENNLPVPEIGDVLFASADFKFSSNAERAILEWIAAERARNSRRLSRSMAFCFSQRCFFGKRKIG